MPPELLSLLIQLPVVALFIWYSERKDKQFLQFLREQRDAEREILRSLIVEIKSLEELQENHDKRMSEAVTTMKERTAIRASARGRS